MKYLASKDCLLFSFLSELYPDSSHNTLRSWLKAGRVHVNGKQAVKANLALTQGAEVMVGPKVNFLDHGIKVLFEDDDLVVLEKPEGLLSVATDFDDSISVHSILKKRFHKQRVFPVHRLDRETSGVMIFAYSDYARKQLKSQFEKHTIEKVYYAIVEGKLPQPTGKWESYLEEDALYFVSSTTELGKGKLAITHYEQVRTNQHYALLRLMPLTGKKHQLRVHCREAGITIAGDKRYEAQHNPLDRLCLHAHKITFTHPATGKRMTFESAIPLAFEGIIALPRSKEAIASKA